MIKVINRAQAESENTKKQHKNTHQTKETRICRALCCTNTARFSISSSSSSSSSGSSNRHYHHHNSISSLTHYMVQEKLTQMIKEREEARNLEKMKRKKMRSRRRSDNESNSVISHTKFIVMMAMEKCSYDPRQDFRDSMIEMIVANKIKEADELRSLLDYYLSMNSSEYRSVILEIYYEVCAHLFLCS